MSASLLASAIMGMQNFSSSPPPPERPSYPRGSAFRNQRQIRKAKRRTGTLVRSFKRKLKLANIKTHRRRKALRGKRK